MYWLHGRGCCRWCHRRRWWPGRRWWWYITGKWPRAGDPEGGWGRGLMRASCCCCYNVKRESPKRLRSREENPKWFFCDSCQLVWYNDRRKEKERKKESNVYKKKNIEPYMLPNQRESESEVVAFLGLKDLPKLKTKIEENSSKVLLLLLLLLLVSILIIYTCKKSFLYYNNNIQITYISLSIWVSLTEPAKGQKKRRRKMLLPMINCPTYKERNKQLFFSLLPHVKGGKKDDFHFSPSSQYEDEQRPPILHSASLLQMAE